MRRILKVLKIIPDLVAKLALFICYVIIIMPYRLVMRKEEGGWQSPEADSSDISKMW